MQNLPSYTLLRYSESILSFAVHPLYENIWSILWHEGEARRRWISSYHGARMVAPWDNVEPLCNWARVSEIQKGSLDVDSQQWIFAYEPEISL
jgi:hypothetical protein